MATNAEAALEGLMRTTGRSESKRRGQWGERMRADCACVLQEGPQMALACWRLCPLCARSGRQHWRAFIKSFTKASCRGRALTTLKVSVFELVPPALCVGGRNESGVAGVCMCVCVSTVLN